MWRDDNDTIDGVFDDIYCGKNVGLPLRCPICGEMSIIFYMYRWHDKQPKGGLWIWCSECMHFSHGTVDVPEWWENSNEITIDMLDSLPNKLDEKKQEIVNHLNYLMQKKSK